MTRPKSVKIFGQRYKVKYDLQDDDIEGVNMGLTDQWSNTIRLQSSLQEDKLARVFMHEVTHAILNETTLALRKRFDVEEVCDIVGFHVIDVLKLNPDIVEWLLKEVEE